MKQPRRPDRLSSILPLVSVSVVAVVLLGLRALVTRHPLNLSLIWNLFLAWIPLWLAWGLERRYRSLSGRMFWAWMVVWLLFFPNAPYILTDLIHLPSPHRSSWWTELVVHLLFAMTGLVTGFLSLRIMQRLVAIRHGTAAGAAVAIGFSGLAGLGIYIGRFERWNTWDVVVNPVGIAMDAPNWFQPQSLKMILLFSILVLGAHGLLMALVPAGVPEPEANRRRGVFQLP